MGTLKKVDLQVLKHLEAFLLKANSLKVGENVRFIMMLEKYKQANCYPLIMTENRYLNLMAQLCGPYVRNFRQGKLGNFFCKGKKKFAQEGLLVASLHFCPAVKI